MCSLTRAYFILCMTSSWITVIVTALAFFGRSWIYWDAITYDLNMIDMTASDSTFETSVAIYHTNVTSILTRTDAHTDTDTDTVTHTHTNASQGFLMVSYILKNKHANETRFSVSNTVVRETETFLYVPVHSVGGIWAICDTNDEAILEKLRNDPLLYPSGKSYQPCVSYITGVPPDGTNLLVSLFRSAASCAIVVMMIMLVCTLLGTFSAIRQQIVFAMITGVCYFAAGIYIFFTVTLMLLRKKELQRSNFGFLPENVVKSRSISSSWALWVCWTALAVTIATGFTWLLFSTQLKKDRANYIYSTQYDQICSRWPKMKH